MILCLVYSVFYCMSWKFFIFKVKRRKKLQFKDHAQKLLDPKNVNLTKLPIKRPAVIGIGLIAEQKDDESESDQFESDHSELWNSQNCLITFIFKHSWIPSWSQLSQVHLLYLFFQTAKFNFWSRGTKINRPNLQGFLKILSSKERIFWYHLYHRTVYCEHLILQRNNAF